jgi:hypothetical protein
MNKIMNVFIFTVVFALSAGAFAHEGLELGFATGTTHSLAPDSFKSATTTGQAHMYWLGYGINQNLGVEISHEFFDFDTLNTRYSNYTLSATYVFFSPAAIHPLFKFGVGTSDVESAFFAHNAQSYQAKAAIGLEADFKYISVGVLFNYIYLSRANITPDYEKASMLIPALYLTIHGASE